MPEPRFFFHSSWPVLAFERAEVAVQVAPEHQIAAGRQRAAVERQVRLQAPDLLVLDRIPGDQFAVVAAGAVVRGEFAAEIEDAALVADVADRPVHADVVAGDVDEAGLRVVRHRLPVLAADRGSGRCPWPDDSGRAACRRLRPARPVAMSHFSAQVVGTYFSADSTLPVSRLVTKKKPLRSAFIIAGTVSPPILRSASTSSLTPS